MDLGIRGRKAIVCASSQGLGKGCARALAEAGVSLVINGRNRQLLDQTADEIRQAAAVDVWPWSRMCPTREGQEALLAACPAPDILINNNGGPPFRDFRELDRQALLTGVTMNMVTPIELIQRVIDGMAARGFGRIVNITSVSVKMPLQGSICRAPRRAGLTAFSAGVARGVADKNVTINNLLPGSFDTARLRGGLLQRRSAAVFQNPSSLGGRKRRFRRSASVRRRSLGRPAHFCAVCMPGTSPAKIFCSTEELIQRHSEGAREPAAHTR